MFIVAAKRTPFGTYGGLLKGLSATDLTEHAARAALAAGKVPPEIIDSVIVGNVLQVGSMEIWLVGTRFSISFTVVPYMVISALQARIKPEGCRWNGRVAFTV